MLKDFTSLISLARVIRLIFSNSCGMWLRLSQATSKAYNIFNSLTLPDPVELFYNFIKSWIFHVATMPQIICWGWHDRKSQHRFQKKQTCFYRTISDKDWILPAFHWFTLLPLLQVLALIAFVCAGPIIPLAVFFVFKGDPHLFFHQRKAVDSVYHLHTTSATAKVNFSHQR